MTAAPLRRGDGYKRILDSAILILSVIFAFPLWLLLWTLIPLCIWLSDRGPVFYVQERVGQEGRVFRMFKFRTMIVNAENATGAVRATAHDPRITGVGRVLRRTHLDEAPQVINVLRREMSLVGPRPERPEETATNLGIPGFELRLRVRPGIAGLAQVRGRSDISLRNKFRYDNLYIENLCPWMDVKLLVKSLWLSLSPSPELGQAPRLMERRLISYKRIALTILPKPVCRATG